MPLVSKFLFGSFNDKKKTILFILFVILESRWLYNTKDGYVTLKSDARGACKLLNINESDLERRDYESFAEPGLAAVRQQLRFEHYEEKRKLKIKALETLVKKAKHVETSEGQQLKVLLREMKTNGGAGAGHSGAHNNSGLTSIAEGGAG